MSIELDDDDRRAIHFLASVGATAVGTARVVWHGAPPDRSHGGAETLPAPRRGPALLTRAVAVARGLKARRIYLHAQVAVSGFYERRTFAVRGALRRSGHRRLELIWRGRQSGRQRRVDRH